MTKTKPVGDATWGDIADLLPRYGNELLNRSARSTHKAFSTRIGQLGGPLVGVGNRPQSVIADAVYAGLDLGLGVAERGGKHLRGRGGAVPPLVQSAIAGFVGERLRDEEHPCALPMAVRVRGNSIAPTTEELRDAFPRATGALVVFLHGLCETEKFWHRAERPSYGQALAQQGWTPIDVRYNSGLAVRENGANLAGLLGQLVAQWPTEVTRIALVGHSMGGLVARAAVGLRLSHDEGQQSTTSWLDLTSDLITLGTPHFGARLARQATWGSGVLRRLPESSAFHEFLEHRGPGIRDLDLGLTQDVPVPAHVKVRLVSASLPGVPGFLVGDLLVDRQSAQGVHRRHGSLFPGADVVHLPRATHFSVLNHPTVHLKLKEWLA